MSDKIFVDTNILVYSRDTSEPEKQQQAIAWMALKVAPYGLKKCTSCKTLSCRSVAKIPLIGDAEIGQKWAFCKGLESFTPYFLGIGTDLGDLYIPLIL